MKRIRLTQGKVAFVDNADYEWLNQRKWYAAKWHHVWYAVHNSLSKKGRQRLILMHRKILDLKHGDPRRCDHKNGDGLDNRRENLRVATHAQNIHNQRPRKGGTSIYKGVSWNQRSAKWAVCIYVNRRQIYLGYFDNEIEAAKTYDKAAKLFFGEFARTNF